MTVTNQEYSFLIGLEKTFDDGNVIDLTKAWSKKLSSSSTQDLFILDYHIGTLQLEKYTFNKRYRTSIILLRYDNVGRHTNPDGTVFDGPHVHVYKEGYMDKIAFEVSEIGIEEGFQKTKVFEKFLNHCNVVNIPQIQSSLI